MARVARNSKTDSRTSRAKLAARREPYWTKVSEGCFIGYRRGAKSGTWIARFRTDAGAQTYESLGAADDHRDADGLTVFSSEQAQAKAREWFDRKAREQAGLLVALDAPYTVADALRDYFSHRERKGSKGVYSDRKVADARIVPTLGTTEVSKLTSRKIRDWHHDLAAAPKLVRTKAGADKRKTRAHDPNDADAVRARRSSANRQLTILKAALNHAYREGIATSDEAWRKVAPFKAVDDPVIRFLSADECRRLVNASDADFRNLVRGALLTGCRYGELARMRVTDFHPDGGTVLVRESKGGKPRHVVLTEEGQELFAAIAAGRPGTALIFVHEDGERWKASQQQRPIEEASERAKIEPAATFHVLRHTHASHLAMKGVPMRVIADQLGHADTRITERHYAHLAPSYVAETIRAHFPKLGLGDAAGGNVARIDDAKRRARRK